MGSGFGAAAPASTSAFGGGGFGSATPAFGQQAARPGGFGAPASTPAFGGGAAPTSGFGATPSTPFGSGGGGFGQAAQPSQSPFGGGSSGFGQQQQTQSAFGVTTTGSAFGGQPASSAFGAPASTGFGASAQGRGSRAVAYRKTTEIDQSSTGARSTIHFNSITCMPEYTRKSVEELRWEDYQDGVKGGGQAGSPAGTSGGMLTLGANTSSPSPFGQPASQPATGFGGSNTNLSFGGGFGSAASTPVFGAQTSTPAFGGGFGASQASSAAPFGSMAASSAPAFGSVSSTPAFGSSQPAGSLFGGSSTPAFGAASSASAFGTSHAPSSSPGFGGFGASSASTFGASQTPSFGIGSSTPAFAGQQTPGLFGSGAASSPGTGFMSQGGSLFGGTASTAKPGGFSFPTASTPPLSGQGQSQGTSLFGGAGTPSSTQAFGGGGSLFGTSTPLGGSQPQQSLFSTTPSAAGRVMPLGGTNQMPNGNVNIGGAASPYGAMPEAPKVTPLPEYKAGLTQRILAPPSAGPPKPIALITPRSLTPHGGGKLRPRQVSSGTRLSKSPAEFFASSSLQATTPSSMKSPGAGSERNIFVPRDNPRRLLVRDELPSTSAAAQTSAVENGEAETPASDGRNGNFASPSSLTFRSLSPLQDKENGAQANEALGVLPVLENDDYYIEPSIVQLTAMAKEDPESLAAVSNFTVGRNGMGSIKWLEPVDIRGAHLDDLINLAKGIVEVYPDASVKPPVGHGLNKPAMVTMLKVFKIDKETGKPTKDPEVVEKYSRKLKAKAAAQGSRFVSYDGETGVWKFEVDHFSRYGLLDSSDDEDEEMDKVYSVAEKSLSIESASEDSNDEIVGLIRRSPHGSIQELEVSTETLMTKKEQEWGAKSDIMDQQVSDPGALIRMRYDHLVKP